MTAKRTAEATVRPSSAPAHSTSTQPPRFVTGSLMRHIVVMAGTGAVGLVAIFAVDLINLLYISLLGEQAVAAAVGFAGVVAFFHLSVFIGMLIGIAAVVSRLIGAQRMAEARCMSTSSLVLCAMLAAALTAITLVWLEPALRLLGAEGRVLELAQRFLYITLPSTVLLGVGMACSALLRSVGDARRAMLVTLIPAVVTAVLDPLFIFGFGLGLDGAATVVVMARVVLATVGLHGAWRVQKLLAPLDWKRLRADAKALFAVAGPAVLTNVATPVSAALVTHSVAGFGPSAVAGQATIDRLVPVAFGLIYSLSGAVGPVLAQNLGARRYDRVQAGLRASVWFMVAAVSGAWLLLALLQGPLVRLFSLQGVAAEMVHAFCSWLAGGFLFMGALFVANAAFNNLGRPLWSTGFNWARATLGTLPFVWWGAQHGPIHVLAGQAAGATLFGSLALWTAFRLTHTLASEAKPTAKPPNPSADR
ncbi:MAG TPA: MATE family efflux transporter [Burkholderiaceae bacterium]|nr:MATE family efflux transporter [Burkholderiaceae bacterium]